MDFYPDQHAYRVARMAIIEDDANENDSWVMLSREGEIVKLPHEKIFYKVRSRIGLELATPKVFRDAPPFSAKSDSGLVYITNSRFIYLPARPTDAFKSFSAPILNFEDTHVTSTFFGPWTWNGIVKPVSRGGIPPEIPRLEIKLTFREGGHDAFQTKFETMKERLQHARDLQQETGQQITTDEPLPQYEPRGGAGAPPQAATSQQTAQAGPGPGPGPGPSGSSQSQGRSNQPQPDEPPPDYEEAQAQAIGMRLEDHVREEADRE